MKLLLLLTCTITLCSCSTTSPQQVNQEQTKQLLNEAPKLSNKNVVDLLESRLKNVGKMIKLKKSIKQSAETIEKQKVEIEKLTALRAEDQKIIETLKLENERLIDNQKDNTQIQKLLKKLIDAEKEIEEVEENEDNSTLGEIEPLIIG